MNHSKGICVIGRVHVKDIKSGTSVQCAKPELDINLGEDFKIGFISQILKVLLVSPQMYSISDVYFRRKYLYCPA